MSRIALITGAAGFIGFHLSQRLLDEGYQVIGIDNLSDYYDPNLKRQRLALLVDHPSFTSIIDSIESPGVLMRLFAQHRPEVVVHLAAQAGVRWSIENPRAYLESNINGSFELLEAARAHPPQHLLIASTSSVYGANDKMPYAETDRADHPMSFYAASKKAVEAMAHSHAHIYGLPVTMFRFFTVYGPWGRPDMALFKFTKAIFEGQPIEVYNHGDMRRDFTYIDDLIAGLRGLIDCPPKSGDGKVSQEDSRSPVAPWRVVNIGNADPIRLDDFITAIEEATGRRAERKLMPMQPGDVLATWADTSLIRHLTGHALKTPITQGVRAFVAWYRDYYRI